MKNIARRMSNTAFDVAAGPLYLTIIGIPLLILATVAVLTIVVMRLINKAHDKNIAEGREPGIGDASGIIENAPAGGDASGIVENAPGIGDASGIVENTPAGGDASGKDA